jgi:hypothetical protein
MSKLALLSATIALIIKQTINDCLSNDDLSFFNFTSTGGLLNNSTDICGPIYNTSGYCATPESVRATVKASQEALIKQIVDKMGNITDMVKKVRPQFENATKEANEFKRPEMFPKNETRPQNAGNGPQPNGRNNTNPNGGNSTQPPKNQTTGKQPSGGNGTQPQQGGQQPPQGGQQPPQGGQKPASGTTGGLFGQTATDPASKNNTAQGPPPQNSNNTQGPPSKNSNETQGPPKSESENQQNPNKQENNKQGRPPIDKKNLDLNDRVLNSMTKMGERMSNLTDFLGPMINEEKRRDCQEAIARIIRGTTCMLSSGDGSKIIVKDASGAIVSILINPNAISNFITKCGGMILNSCNLREMQATLGTAVGDSSLSVTNSTKPSYCTNNATFIGCIENAKDCPVEVQNEVIRNELAFNKFVVASSIQIDSVLSTTAVIDASLTNSTSIAAAALVWSGATASSSATITFSPSASAPNPDVIGVSSSIPTVTEANISIPETLKSSSYIIAVCLQALLFLVM